MSNITKPVKAPKEEKTSILNSIFGSFDFFSKEKITANLVEKLLNPQTLKNIFSRLPADWQQSVEEKLKRFGLTPDMAVKYLFGEAKKEDYLSVVYDFLDSSTPTVLQAFDFLKQSAGGPVEIVLSTAKAPESEGGGRTVLVMVNTIGRDEHGNKTVINSIPMPLKAVGYYVNQITEEVKKAQSLASANADTNLSSQLARND